MRAKADPGAGVGPRVMILAGEASGDAHAAQVAAEIRKRWPHAALVGLGGERMARAGVELLCGLRELSVMGFAEVVRRLPFFRRLEGRIRALLEDGDFDIVIPVDYPGFNMRVSACASKLGVPVLYYIGPQVWAWKAGRAKRLAGMARGIALILPFEPRLYRMHGGHARFVGHPLLDATATADPLALAGTLGMDGGKPVLAIFPGSRDQELERHCGPFTEAAQLLQRRVAGLQVIVSRLPHIPLAAYRGFPFPMTTDAASLRALATAGLVKSGTNTLEAALAGMPFVVAYITHPLTHFLARRLVRVPSIALASLVAGESVAREFVQRDATPETIAGALEPLLDRTSTERAAAVEGLAKVRASMGTPGAAVRVVDMMEEILSDQPTRTTP